MKQAVCVGVIVAVGWLSAAQTAIAQNPPMSVKALMTPLEFEAAGLKKLSTTELAALDKWFEQLAAAVLESSARPSGSETPRPVSPKAADLRFSLVDLEGAIIVSQDGKALGEITSNCFKREALCNDFGTYGNPFSSDSILNEFGTYGNPFSAKSPFNEFSSTPPKIFKDGQQIAYLSLNTSLSPRVDPLWLLGALKIKR